MSFRVSFCSCVFRSFWCCGCLACGVGVGLGRAGLGAFRTFVRFVLVWICRFPLPLGVWEVRRFMIVAPPWLFSYLFIKPRVLRTYWTPLVQTYKDEVRLILESMKSGKASGPDGINNFILKTCATELAELLSELFNYSLHTAKVPMAWKMANVTPIFLKKDDPSDCKNYRPISLLSALSKAFEKLFINMF